MKNTQLTVMRKEGNKKIEKEVNSSELVVGDILIISEGEVTVDLLILKGEVLIDESNLTGESHVLQKKGIFLN